MIVPGVPIRMLDKGEHFIFPNQPTPRVKVHTGRGWYYHANDPNKKRWRTGLGTHVIPRTLPTETKA